MSMPTILMRELLVKDIYAFANYETIRKSAQERGSCMKESRDFYAQRILITISRLCEGKSKDEIAKIVAQIGQY